MKSLVQDKKIYAALLISVVLFSFFIRVHNLINYNTWWADDGGAHLEYVNVILENKRLPAPEETYLAWHEPLFYIGMAIWKGLGEVIGIENILNWQESLQVIISLVFIALVWCLTKFYTKNKWVALANVSLVSVLFVGVKLSAYVNNELLVQTLIILLTLLFLKWKLYEKVHYNYAIVWSVILGIATLVKLTAIIPFLAALVTWTLILLLKRKKEFLIYILLSIVVVFLVNTPWLIYKQNNFGSAFSINLYEEDEVKQGIFASDAWDYIFELNKSVVVDNPYWFSLPYSFTSIAFVDTFGDYYNLFNNVDEINKITDSKRILVKNGRYTTSYLWQSMLRVTRSAISVSLFWLVGIIGLFITSWKKRDFGPDKFFLTTLFVGGWAALLYNNIRLPYLERGILKVAFIYFTFPIGAMLSYYWWYEFLKEKWFWALLVFGPILIYTIVALPVLLVGIY